MERPGGRSPLGGGGRGVAAAHQAAAIHGVAAAHEVATTHGAAAAHGVAAGR